MYKVFEYYVKNDNCIALLTGYLNEGYSIIEATSVGAIEYGNRSTAIIVYVLYKKS